MKLRKIRWKNASLVVPHADPEYPDKRSIRVLVWWHWDRNRAKQEEPRFAQYYYKSGHWIIEGILGNTTVVAWAEIKNPIIED